MCFMTQVPPHHADLLGTEANTASAAGLDGVRVTVSVFPCSEDREVSPKSPQSLSRAGLTARGAGMAVPLFSRPELQQHQGQPHCGL